MVDAGSIMMGRWTTRLGALLGVALATACSDRGADGGVGSGDLGFATFRWECAGAGDVACVPEQVAGFPRGVAVGASFEASFVLDDDLPRRIEPGRLELVGPKAEEVSSSPGGEGYDGSSRARFTTLEAGEVTLMAMASDDTVADHVTLSLRPVSSLAVVRDCRSRSCDGAVDGGAVGSVSAGDRIDVRAEPYGNGVLLVGDLDYTWESLTPELAEVTRSDGHVATLELRGEGTAYVRAAGGGAEDTVAIEVVSDGPHRRRPGESTGSGTDGGSSGSEGSGTDAGSEGSGTDAGSGTDTDAGTGSTTGGMQ
jgi:hypothetical protein